MVPHSALRYFALGERARDGPSTADERERLVRELRRSLAGGALGFASSRGPNHCDAHGEPVPSRHADDAELRVLAGACAGRPWQINAQTKFAGDAEALTAEVERYARWTEEAGARLTWSPLFAEPGEDRWQRVLAHNRALNAQVAVAPQVCAQPVTTALRFDRPSIAAVVAGWQDAMKGFFGLGPQERLARVRDPAFRAALRAAPQDCAGVLAPCYREWSIAFTRSRPELLGRSLAEAAVAHGLAPSDLLCELAVADELATELQVPVANRDRDGAAAMAADAHTLIGLGDSGAHVTSVTSYTYPTYLLARMVRDEGRLPLELAVARITSHPARFFGLPQRGELRPGSAADLCVVELDRLALGPLRLAPDLPGGAPRLFQGARGYRAVVVNGEVTLSEDRLTGRRPGQAIRAT
jgi:N-acyl-D-aspartate/D-glutamate deacylase